MPPAFASLLPKIYVLQCPQKILRENIRVVRKQMRSYGIEIKTEFGQGYTMPRESKAKLRKLAVLGGKRVGSA